MNKNGSWEILFYQERNGFSPIIAFLHSLSKEDQSAIHLSMSKLRELNIWAREPLVRHINGKLWELRASRCSNPYRFIYTVRPQRQIVLLHGFHKKTQKPHAMNSCWQKSAISK